MTLRFCQDQIQYWYSKWCNSCMRDEKEIYWKLYSAYQDLCDYYQKYSMFQDE